MRDHLDREGASGRGSPLAHVLVSTDFSAGASRAMDRTACLPLARGGRVSILHVLPRGLPQNVRSRAEKVARGHLDRLTRGALESLSARGRTDVDVSPHLGAGRAYVEILRRARASGAELIVMGRHGRRPLKDMFIGSTASRVIRAGDVPVLVVSRPATGAYRRPMVAVDLEDTSRAVVDLALRVFGPEVSSAVIAHAYHVPFEGVIAPSARPAELTAYRKKSRDSARSDLARLIASLPSCGVEWRTSVRRGDARSVILMDAARRRTDLLVIGTHARSGVSHALLGSVAESILDGARIDVLVARPALESFELP